MVNPVTEQACEAWLHRTEMANLVTKQAREAGLHSGKMGNPVTEQARESCEQRLHKCQSQARKAAIGQQSRSS